MRRLTRQTILIGAAIALGLILSGKGFAAGGSTFEEANGKYAAGDFKSAAALYEKIIRAGNASPAVYYNYGNAQLRFGQKGEALLAYRRAERVIPRDKDLQWNLAVLKNALTDRIEEPDENLALFGLKKTVGLFSIDEIAVIFSIILAVLFILTVLELSFGAIRPFTRLLKILLWMSLAVAAFLFAVKWADVKDPRVVILDQEVNAFYGPSEKETKAFAVHEGAEAKVLDQSNDWFYVTLKNKNTGWIPKSSCELI